MINDRKWWKSSLTVLTVGVLLCVAGTAVAASDLSGLVSTDDGDAATGRAASQPLGTLSEDTPQVLGDQEEGTEVLGQQPGGGGRDEGSNEVLGSQPAGGSDAGGGGGGDELPFTGLLAIPLLGLGAVMLLVGVALRRRTPRTATN